MTQSLLVAYDGSDPSVRALETAATAFQDPALTVLHVIDPMDVRGPPAGEGQTVENIQEQRNAQAAQHLAEATDHLAEHPIEPQTEHRVGEVAREVVAYADANDIDHIVVGSHGRRGMKRFLLGSVAEKVVRRSPVPVTVVG